MYICFFCRTTNLPKILFSFPCIFIRSKGRHFCHFATFTTFSSNITAEIRNIPSTSKYITQDLQKCLPLQKVPIQTYFRKNCGRPDQRISANRNPLLAIGAQAPALFAPLAMTLIIDSMYICIPIYRQIHHHVSSLCLLSSLFSQFVHVF